MRERQRRKRDGRGATPFRKKRKKGQVEGRTRGTAGWGKKGEARCGHPHSREERVALRVWVVRAGKGQEVDQRNRRNERVKKRTSAEGRPRGAPRVGVSVAGG